MASWRFAVLALVAGVADPILDWLRISPGAAELAAGLVVIVPALDLLWQGPAGRVAANPTARPLRLGGWPYGVPLLAGPAAVAGVIAWAAEFGRGATIGGAFLATVVTTGLVAAWTHPPRGRTARGLRCVHRRRDGARRVRPHPRRRLRALTECRVDPPLRRRGRDHVAMRLGRTLCALAFLCAVLALDAAPAAAHGVGGLQPTNVRSRVLSIEPATPGVDVKVIENGRRLELTNDSGATVVVSGYENEPYLRVGPDGVFENTRSPAVFQNRSLNAPAKIPARYDASAAPEWHKVSDADHVRWHDHRAHYMGTGSFKASQWSVPLTVDGRPVVVQGDLAWVTPGPWWPWLVLTLAIVGVIVLAAQRAWRLTVSLTLALLVWAELLHVVGSWSEVATTTRRSIRRAGAVVRRDRRRRPRADARRSRSDDESSAPFVLIAAVTFIVAGGIGDVASWFRSQLPSSLAAPAVRALVAFALGGGTGLVIASARRLAPRVRTTAAPEPVRQ